MTATETRTATVRTETNTTKPEFENIHTYSSGEFGSEFEGLRGGSRMMSLVTLFGGLKNVFKVGWDKVFLQRYEIIDFESSICIQSIQVRRNVFKVGWDSLFTKIYYATKLCNGMS